MRTRRGWRNGARSPCAATNTSCAEVAARSVRGAAQRIADLSTAGAPPMASVPRTTSRRNFLKTARLRPGCGAAAPCPAGAPPAHTRIIMRMCVVATVRYQWRIGPCTQSVHHPGGIVTPDAQRSHRGPSLCSPGPGTAAAAGATAGSTAAVGGVHAALTNSS